MQRRKMLYYSLIATMAAILFNAPISSFASPAKKATAHPVKAVKQKLVIQVNNAANVQEDLGKENVEVEIVAYGPGLGMLKLESEVGDRIKGALEGGVKVVACENTMRKQKLSQGDMLTNLSYAKAGVVELMTKQAEGYAYIRP